MFRTIIIKLSFPVYRLRLFKKLIRKWMLKLENPCNLSDFLGYQVYPFSFKLDILAQQYLVWRRDDISWNYRVVLSTVGDIKIIT